MQGQAHTLLMERLSFSLDRRWRLLECVSSPEPVFSVDVLRTRGRPTGRGGGAATDASSFGLMARSSLLSGLTLLVVAQAAGVSVGGASCFESDERRSRFVTRDAPPLAAVGESRSRGICAAACECFAFFVVSAFSRSFRRSIAANAWRLRANGAESLIWACNRQDLIDPHAQYTG